MFACIFVERGDVREGIRERRKLRESRGSRIFRERERAVCACARERERVTERDKERKKVRAVQSVWEREKERQIEMANE